jgi:Zn-dependent M28 family amino/carboxypeptidase
MLLPAFLLPFAVGVCLTLCGFPELADPLLLALLVYPVMIGSLALIMFGPANKHTANDNTSGVTVLLELMTSLPEEQKERAAFIFFDLEELGLFGSAGFAKKHKASMQDRLLINFDCVSDGEHMLFTTAKKSRRYAEQLREVFPSTEAVEAEVTTRGVFYPSDQANFPCGVGVAALKRSRFFGLLYMNRIHTTRDTVYREENIAFLVKGCITLTEAL